MAYGTIILPEHTGQDGLGLDIEVIDELLLLIKNGVFTEAQIQQAVNLCCEQSTATQWKDYRAILYKKLEE
jgi:hypothetical protein